MDKETHTVDDVRPGDRIAYPAILRAEHKGVRTELDVERVEHGMIVGTVVGEDAGTRYPQRHVTPEQLADNGVIVVARSPQP